MTQSPLEHDQGEVAASRLSSGDGGGGKAGGDGGDCSRCVNAKANSDAVLTGSDPRFTGGQL